MYNKHCEDDLNNQIMDNLWIEITQQLLTLCVCHNMGLVTRASVSITPEVQVVYVLCVNVVCAEDWYYKETSCNWDTAPCLCFVWRICTG